MPERRALRSPRHARRAGRSRLGATASALLAAGCAQPPQAPADLVERFADAYVQLLPLGRVMDLAAAKDAHWPLGEKAGMVSGAQLGCVRRAMSSPVVTPRQRQAARDYAHAHPATLQADLQILEAGAARVLGQAMVWGAEGKTTQPLAGATAAEARAVAAFVLEPRYADLRRATGVAQMLGASTQSSQAIQGGRGVAQGLLVHHLTDAFLSCHIPVKLLY